MSVMSRYGLDRRDVRQAAVLRAAGTRELHACDNFTDDITEDERVGVGSPPSYWRATDRPPERPTDGMGGLAAKQSGCDEQPSGTVLDASGLGNPERKDSEVGRVVALTAGSRSELFQEFYRDLMYEFGEHAQRGGTAYGAAAVLKRVALAHGLAVAEHTPVVRPTRAERETVRDAAWAATAGRTDAEAPGRTDVTGHVDAMPGSLGRVASRERGW